MHSNLYSPVNVKPSLPRGSLELENNRLKRLLADAELDKAMLKELAEGNF